MKHAAENKSFRYIALTMVLVDTVIIIVSDLLCFLVRFDFTFPPVNFAAYMELSPFIVVFRLAACYTFRLYEAPKYKGNFEIIINALKATTISSVVIIFVLYFLDIEAYPRTIAVLSWVLTTASLSLWRFLAKNIAIKYLGKNFFLARLIIIGTGREARELAMNILRDATINYKILGFLKTHDSEHVEVDKAMVLGTIDSIPSILKIFTVDEIILADASLERRRLTRFASLLRKNNITVKSTSSSYDRVITDMLLSGIETSFVGPASFRRPSSWYWGAKKIMDLIGSAAILILTLPVFLLTALLIKATSPGPVFYLQKRVGQNGKSFIIYKFRSMRLNSERYGRARWAMDNDPRITPLGRLLRRYRIDELPQLFNVLKGDMSLIGPRPERLYFTHKLIRDIPYYSERLQVKPGISGWAQVNFKYASTEEDARKKLVYDLFYTQNMSFMLDLLILMKTLKVVFSGQGAH